MSTRSSCRPRSNCCRALLYRPGKASGKGGKPGPLGRSESLDGPKGKGEGGQGGGGKGGDAFLGKVLEVPGSRERPHRRQ
eukprot:663626-Alexandrium_andersonii.AAC.1